MPLVMNASATEQEVKVHGSYFTFKPKQIKEMQDDKAFFLTSQRAYQGFVGLSDEFSDIDYRNSKEGQEKIKEAERQGIQARCTFLEGLRRNELISLSRDLEMKGLKYDPRLEMSDQMVKQLEELTLYKSKKQDDAQAKVDQIKKLEALLED